MKFSKVQPLINYIPIFDLLDDSSSSLIKFISLVIILYAGFKWMTSGGNEEDVKSAQKILTAAVVGLIIIMSAYAITRFVMTQLFKATAGYDYSTTLDGY